ncbi:restriction endonuclease subunit S [Lacticaseibacillus paracasei]|uniref:restriction endonuclease subunit S n=1 Tax=Lacticaseibacillus paracasei TaxID=1597 RepID=UPI0021AAC802|nr:restriction endonuclease subunit S [Lacticaseibacillus paracasei]MCT4394300.1 restriction endonuclease subunit S [Lacticaseibacillus paracasei]
MKDNQAKYPQLRFKGFTDPWVQRNLGDLAEIVRGASPRPIQDPKWFDDSSEIGWLRISDVTEQNGRIHHLDQHISEAGQAKTRVLTEPHLLLSIAATVGKPLVNYVKTGVHDGFLIFMNPKFDLEFMFQWLESYRDKWSRYGQPGSQVNLNSDLVKNQSISIPSMDEQQKLGEFFKKLDNLIAANQRKLDLLKEQKKGYLQKMFPKNGSKFPQLRFAGFADAWEQRKLKDVVEKQIKGKAQFEKLAPGEVEYLDTSRLNGGQAILTNGLKDVTLDDILILWDGSKAGTVYHGFEGALGSTLKAYRTSANSKFVYQYLKRHQDNIYNNYRTPNIPHVQKDFLNVFTISVPVSAEQEKIGSFFKQLDDTIDLHQRKLEKLQELKKGYLQKMFC